MSAPDVQDALLERISRGIYQPGSRLPPVRALATELGASQSTISRAFQEMERDGWIQIQDRKGVTVSRKLPQKSDLHDEWRNKLESIAHKWKLSGGKLEEFTDLAKSVADNVFSAQTRIIFTECNNFDLNSMADELSRELDLDVDARILMADLDKSGGKAARAAVIVPYYHYSEVKEILGDSSVVVPVHFGPSQETLDRLLGISDGTHVVVVGMNDRSADRSSAIVSQYADVSVTKLTLSDKAKLKKFSAKADVVVTVQSIAREVEKLTGAEKLIVIRFALEGEASTLKMKIASVS